MEQETHLSQVGLAYDSSRILRLPSEELGYVRAGGSDDRIRMQKKSLPDKDPMREIVIKSKGGSITWVSNTGYDSKLGGDVFHLHQHSTGQGFLQARDALRKFADNKEFEAGVSYEGMSTPEREAKIQARKEEEEIRKEFRKVAVFAAKLRVSDFLCNRLMSDTVAPNRRHHELWEINKKA